MWPLDAASRREVLRIGRHRVERWHRHRGRLSFVSAHPVGDYAPDALRSALALALRGPGARADAVIESAWAPVFSLDLGESAWSGAGAEPLLRHRLSLAWRDAPEPPGEWTLRVDHRPGDRHALGFAVAPTVLAAIESAAEDAKRTIASLQPALTWGWGHSGDARKKLAPEGGWWAWREQDRLLLAHVDKGRVAALNPAVGRVSSRRDWAAMLRQEAIRLGVEMPGSRAVLCGWSEPAPETRA